MVTGELAAGQLTQVATHGLDVRRRQWAPHLADVDIVRVWPEQVQGAAVDETPYTSLDGCLEQYMGASCIVVEEKIAARLEIGGGVRRGFSGVDDDIDVAHGLPHAVTVGQIGDARLGVGSCRHRFAVNEAKGVTSSFEFGRERPRQLAGCSSYQNIHGWWLYRYGQFGRYRLGFA